MTSTFQSIFVHPDIILIQIMHNEYHQPVNNYIFLEKEEDVAKIPTNTKFLLLFLDTNNKTGLNLKIFY